MIVQQCFDYTGAKTACKWFTKLWFALESLIWKNVQCVLLFHLHILPCFFANWVVLQPYICSHENLNMQWVANCNVYKESSFNSTSAWSTFFSWVFFLQPMQLYQNTLKLPVQPCSGPQASLWVVVKVQALCWTGHLWLAEEVWPPWALQPWNKCQAANGSNKNLPRCLCRFLVSF